MRHKQMIFRNADGTHNIHAQIWLPDEDPKYIVQFVHGMNEYGARYIDFAHFLVSRGVAFAVHDQMGHGDTAADGGCLGVFGTADAWGNLQQDIRNFSVLLKQKYHYCPVFLMGHSMGSFLARCNMIKFNDRYAGIALLSTASNPRLRYRHWQFVARKEKKRLGGDARSSRVQSACFGACVDAYPNEKCRNAWMCSDEQECRAFFTDKQRGFLPTIDSFQALFTGLLCMDKRSNYKKIRKDVPVFILGGTGDPAGRMGEAPKQVYKRMKQAGIADLRLKMYHDMRHDLLFEPDKKQVYADLWNWMEEKYKN